MTGSAARRTIARGGALLFSKALGARLLMTMSMGVRLVFSMVTLIVVARLLGPLEYGLVSAAFAWATIYALLSDFGLPTQSARLIGVEPREAGTIMSDCVDAKALVALVLAPVVVAVVVARFGLSQQSLFLLVTMLAMTIDSFANLLFVVHRSLGLFQREARLVILYNLFHLVLVLTAVWASPTTLSFGLAFLASRVIYLTVSLVSTTRLATLVFRPIGRIRKKLAVLRAAVPYALDSGVTVFYGQMDVVLVSSTLGLREAGLYMAGARFMQGAVPFSQALASVQVPALARRIDPDRRARLATASRYLAEYLVVGLCLAATMLVLGPPVTHLLLGPEYAAVATLWPGFAALTAARFLAAGLGVQLLAMGFMRARIAGTLASMAATVCAFAYLAPDYGIAVVPWTMCAGMLIMSAVYAVLLAIRLVPGR